MKHKLTKIQAGPQYRIAVYEYRGVMLEGRPPRNGWSGASWTWRAIVPLGAGVERSLTAYSRQDLIALVDEVLNNAAEVREIWDAPSAG